MKDSCSINNFLTFDDWDDLDILVDTIQVDIEPDELYVPEKPVVGRGGIDLLTAEQYGLVKLSAATRAAEVRRQQREERKKLGKKNRKPYRIGKGKRHHNTKKATQTRKFRRKWKEQPFSCYITGYGCYNVTKETWDEYVGQYWEKYNSDDLKLTRIKKAPDGTWYGTRQKPYDIYSFNLVHKRDGVVYNGQDMMLYDMSAGKYDEVQSRFKKLTEDKLPAQRGRSKDQGVGSSLAVQVGSDMLSEQVDSDEPAALVELSN